MGIKFLMIITLSALLIIPSLSVWLKYTDRIDPNTFNYNESSLNPKPIDYQADIQFDKPFSIWKNLDKNKNFTTTAEVTSPIDILWFNRKGGIKYPSFPRYTLNGTYYKILNTHNFTWYNISNNQGDLRIVLDDEDYSTAITNFRFHKIQFKLKDIRLKMYSEHTFEGMKMDLEFQLFHQLKDEESFNKTIDEDSSRSEKLTRPCKIMAVSVMFSASLDRHSDFIEELIEEEPDENVERRKYRFAKLKSLDFNQFTDKHEPYFYYQGSGTSPLDYYECVDWFIMKKVNHMSEEQLRKIQLAIGKVYPNGNALAAKLTSDDIAESYNKFSYVEYHSNEETSKLYKNQ